MSLSFASCSSSGHDASIEDIDSAGLTQTRSPTAALSSSGRRSSVPVWRLRCGRALARAWTCGSYGRSILLCAAVLWTMLACKPAVRVNNPSPFETDDPRALPAAEQSPVVREASPATHPRLVPKRGRMRRMTVTRSDVNTVIDQGPGMFLRGVELKPSFHGNRFGGWAIVQFMPGEARFDAIDLAPGDIIGPINGRSIARPQQLTALWSELRSASAIVIVVRRDSQTFELRFDITEEIKPSSP